MNTVNLLIQFSYSLGNELWNTSFIYSSNCRTKVLLRVCQISSKKQRKYESPKLIHQKWQKTVASTYFFLLLQPNNLDVICLAQFQASLVQMVFPLLNSLSNAESSLLGHRQQIFYPESGCLNIDLHCFLSSPQWTAVERTEWFLILSHAIVSLVIYLLFVVTRWTPKIHCRQTITCSLCSLCLHAHLTSPFSCSPFFSFVFF